MTEQRRLAAIVSADIIRVFPDSGRDESGTLALQSCLVHGQQAGVQQLGR